MSCSSSLIDIADPLVLDTSVLINLHACKHGERILTAIPNDIVVPEIVAGELEHETSRRNGEHSFLHGLVTGGIVTLANITDVEYEIFHELTSTSPSLDDGEAATIAVAASRCLLPVIDERKGRTRAGILMKARPPGWSLDLFCHPTAIADLGDQPAVEALYLALRDGRMRIPSERADDVIALIGLERSRSCTCLPGYRERFSLGRDVLDALETPPA
ncbi:DNA-binding protein [Agrobacterium vitis]|uniref:DNA-binding protein n=1 Tax=Rhizobium/Agrobacterium group TaxID=227290 RepID=UPI001F32181C|nr:MULTISPECIES: DNA-binding protein [Rhizobium/Agrobacterium group]MCF1501715.1 DNA-binding protein [Allorhizobium sp. Av2]MCM2438499.1 DNA-binding protein [Agrobacterium vitis]MCM2473165.1 DNA-binding protein [Rhizobium sp. CG5]